MVVVAVVAMVESLVDAVVVDNDVVDDDDD